MKSIGPEPGVIVRASNLASITWSAHALSVVAKMPLT
jgi:hypothetical protein